MSEKRGLFVVFEGIDGSGKETQMMRLAEYVRNRNKYQDVIITHEPWKSAEIKKKLKEDKEAYSDGLKMAALYVNDRIKHSLEIEPQLQRGYFVLCDRYKMSTCAYQWTQGVDLFRLLKIHEDEKIILPDLTLFVDVSAEIAQSRRLKRSYTKEKFEEWKFQNDLVSHYRHLAGRVDCKDLFGAVAEINGRDNPDEVFERVKKAFDPVYENWIKAENV